MQEVDDLLQGVLGFILAGNVVKRLAGLRLDIDLGMRLAKAHGIAAHRFAHPAEHERTQTIEHHQRQHPAKQELDDRAHLLRHNLAKGYIRIDEALDDLVIGRYAIGGVIGGLLLVLLLGGRKGDGSLIDLHLLDVAVFQHIKEFRILHLLDAVALDLREKQRIEQEHNYQRDDVVDNQRSSRILFLMHI